MQHTPRIAIFGAGSIGCYIGGRLLAAGCDVVFIGRGAMAAEIREHGLHLSDHLGGDIVIAGQDIEFTEDPTAAADKDLVIVCVKSAATQAVAERLDHVLKPHSAVLSLQNGLHNVEALEAHMPEQTVLAGMVPFNVLKRGPGHFHQGSEGELVAQQDPALMSFLHWFELAGLPLELSNNMPGVQWGKMLLNLNNPINALANIPLKQQLSQRDFRRCLAAAQREALAVYEARGIRPRLPIILPAPWLPHALELPDFIFARVANKMLAIDPLARSSMWEDLEAGRRTEIDYLNGEIVRLGQEQGMSTPINSKLVELIHQAETGGRRQWSAAELLASLTA